MSFISSSNIKLAFILMLGLIIWFLPVPEGLTPDAWHLMAIFVATVVGLILAPYPLGAVAIFSMTLVTCLGLLNIKQVLAGFSSPTIWMIGCAFFISRGFIKTGFGRRIGYLFIKYLGKSSLGLAYGLVCTDLIFAPAMPSTTARCGGIITPLLRAISETFDSSPQQGTSRKIGAFLIQCVFQCNTITSAMFITAMAANPIAIELARSKGIMISWTEWALAALVPGLVCLILIPLVLYRFYPPELKNTSQMRQLASEKLAEMGRITRDELIMLGVFIGLIILWVLGDTLHIDATLTAFIGLCVLLLTRALSWNDVLSEKEAWHTIIWFAVLLTLATQLNNLGFISWFGVTITKVIGDMSWMPMLAILLLAYYYSHYLMASSVAHVSAMYLIFISLAISAGAPPLLTALVFGMFSNLFMAITHYSGGPAPILFGLGYLSLATWWKIGFLMSLFVIPVWLLSGSVWWRVLGLY